MGCVVGGECGYILAEPILRRDLDEQNEQEKENLRFRDMLFRSSANQRAPRGLMVSRAFVHLDVSFKIH